MFRSCVKDIDPIYGLWFQWFCAAACILCREYMYDVDVALMWLARFDWILWLQSVSVNPYRKLLGSLTSLYVLFEIFRAP